MPLVSRNTYVKIGLLMPGAVSTTFLARTTFRSAASNVPLLLVSRCQYSVFCDADPEVSSQIAVRRSWPLPVPSAGASVLLYAE